jgi:hypothetical protein
MTSRGAQLLPGRPASPRLLGSAAVVLLLIAAAIVVLVLAGRQSASAGPSTATYGGIPKWLPKAKAPVNEVVTATAAKPALAIQGDSVSVHLAHGTVLATAVGPTVPEEGEFPVPSTSPCTFVVTLASTSGSAPVSPGAFTVVDDFGHLHHPHVGALGGGPLPQRVTAGKTVSLRVHDMLPTGDGGLNWAPVGKRVVSWDFDVEID